MQYNINGNNCHFSCVVILIKHSHSVRVVNGSTSLVGSLKPLPNPSSHPFPSPSRYYYCICFVVNRLDTCNIDFAHVNIFNLLIKTHLPLIFIIYLINESKLKIEFIRQKCFTKKIIKFL